jgi:hypothetical protein
VTYSGSKAQAGRGSSLLIGSTPTEIGEVASCSPSGNAWEYVDTSNFDSGVDEEFISTMRNNGEFRCQGNRVASDAGQVLVETAYNSGVINPFTLQLPKTLAQTTTGDKYTFNAYVQTRTFTVGVKEKIAYDITLKVSGPVTLVAGS